MAQHKYLNPPKENWFSDPGYYPWLAIMACIPLMGLGYVYNAAQAPGVSLAPNGRKIPLRGVSAAQVSKDPVLQEQIFEINHHFSEDNMPCLQAHHKHDQVPISFHGLDKNYHIDSKAHIHQKYDFPPYVVEMHQPKLMSQMQSSSSSSQNVMEEGSFSSGKSIEWKDGAKWDEDLAEEAAKIL